MPLEFDIDDAEQRFLREPADNQTPESIYEREWALSVVERVQARIEREFERTGKARHFEHLRAFIVAEDRALPYSEIAVQLGISEGALKVTVHRLRRRFRELMREEISHTVLAPEETRQEIEFLMSLLSK